MARLVADLDSARAEAAARRLHTEMGKLGTAAQTVDARFAKAETGTHEYGRAVSSLRQALNRGVIDQKEYNRLLTVARERYIDASRGAAQYGESLIKTGRQMTNAGAAVSRVALPLAAVGVIAVKLASDFESSFAGIRKTVNATEPEFAALARGMRNLSKEIPVSVNELNRIGEAAGQLGIRTENILSFTKTVAALGVTTNLTADEAATSFAKIANITGLPQDQFDRLGSSLVDLGNNFATTEQDIVAFGLRIAGAGEIAGLTEPQILGIGAALSSVGVEAEAGGTAVQKVLLGMVQAVAAGGDELEVFARTAGLSAEGFAKAFRADAGAAFAAFVMGLGRQGDAAFQTLDQLGLADQRLIRSFLSLAGAGDLVERAMATGSKAFAENTALTTEAEQRYKTFESQLTLTVNELKDVGITIGTALLPVLRDILSTLRPLIAVVAEMAEKFAALPGPIRATAVALGLLTAAAGPALYVMGSLITAAGTIAKTFPVATARVLAFGRSLFALATGPVGAVALAVAAAGLVINEQLKKWRDESQQTIDAMTKGFSELRSAYDELRGALSVGLITDDQIVSARRSIAGIVQEIAKVDKQLKFVSDRSDRDALIVRKDALEQQKRQLEGLLSVAGRLPRINEEIDVTAGGVGDAFTAERKSIKELSAAISAHEKIVQQAEKRISEIEKDYKEFTSAINAAAKALGGLNALDLSQWVEDNFLAGASAVGLMNGNLSDFLERMSRVPRTAEDWRDLAEAIERVEESLDEIGSQRQPIAAPDVAPTDVIFPVPGSPEVEAAIREIHDLEFERAEYSAEIAAALKDGTISIQEAYQISQQLGIEFEHWTTVLADGFDAIGAIVSRFDDDLGRAISRAGDLVRLYQQVGANITAGQALGAVAGNIQGANNADYAVAGAVIGAVIGGIIGTIIPAIGTVVGAEWGAVIGSWLGGMIKKGVPAFYAEIQASVGQAFLGSSPEGGGFQKVARAIGAQITQTIDDILFLVGAELQSIGGGVTISHRRGWSVIVDGLVHYFEDDAEAALSFAITEALQRATITGASPEVIAALQNTIAQDINSLFKDLEVAVEVRDLDLQDVQRAFRKVAQDADFLRKRAEELGFGLEALSRIARSEVRNLGDLRNSILGIQEDPAERIRRQAALFNSELALRRADLQARRAELETKAEMLRVQIRLADAGIDIGRRAVEAQAILFGVEVDIASALLQAAADAAEALELIVGEIAAIDEALAGLAGLDITDADISDAIGRLGSGSRQSDIESLRDLIDQMRFDRLVEGMSDLDASLARLDREYQENLEKAHGNAEVIAALTEEYRLQAEQVTRNIQLSAVDTFQGFMGIGADPFAQLAESYDDARTAVEEAGFGADRAATMVGRLTASYRQQLDVLSREQFVQIGDSLLGLLEKYYGDVEGFEGLRVDLERFRFELEIANLRVQFEILRAQGSLSDAVLSRMEDLFDYIDAHPVDWEAFVAPPAPVINRARSSIDSLSNSFAEMARRLATAKEAIGEYMASLDRGEMGGVSTAQGLAAAESQFNAVVAAAQAGNIQALEQFPDIGRTLIQQFSDAYASGPEFQRIFDLVRSAGQALLGVQTITEDTVVFDERFFRAQTETTVATYQVAERTVGAVHEGAERTSRAVEEMGRVVAAAVERQGERQTDRLGSIQASLDAVLAGQQRLRGAA